MTDEANCDPSVMDHSHEEHDAWQDWIADIDANASANLFDEFGNYKYHVVANLIAILSHDALDTNHSEEVNVY